MASPIGQASELLVMVTVTHSRPAEDPMKTRHKRLSRLPHRIVTTVGDLVAAAYETAHGSGSRRLEEAAQLLTRSPLARSLSRPVVVTR
jgi:hypothetical protein